MKNHEAMTLEECCVELGDDDCGPICDDLDSIAAAMPDGWAVTVWEMQNMAGGWYWTARGIAKSACSRGVVMTDSDTLKIEYADTEILARARLCVACWRASRETP